MRAIATANESSNAAKVKEQREVAGKMEKMEKQASINESINKSIKAEENKVTEAASKRMAEVNSKKATQADEAAKAVQGAQAEYKVSVKSAIS